MVDLPTVSPWTLPFSSTPHSVVRKEVCHHLSAHLGSVLVSKPQPRRVGAGPCRGDTRLGSAQRTPQGSASPEPGPELRL